MRRRKRSHWMTNAIRLEIRRRVAEGERIQAVALAIGCSHMTVRRVLGPMRRFPAVHRRSELRLSFSEREEISRGIEADQSLRHIAGRLGRSPSTVTREVSGTGGRRKYRAWVAEQIAVHRARRPRPRKLLVCTPLRQEVERRLAERWSPQQIAAKLALDYPNESSMRVSHETIYQSLYVQGRGSLRKELKRYLRTGRAKRRHRGARKGRRGVLKDMVMISERPPEIADRAIPGHWEGDLVLGKRLKSAIGTLVERHSRYVMLLRLPKGRTAPHVRAALVSQIKTLPKQLRRSLTWDQGHEMADHLRFTIETGVKVYFCDPHSPWQRGSNENTNGLLRQYFPKGTDLSVHTQRQLNAVAAQLNSRPRQTLQWLTPSQVLARAVATTA